MDKRGTDRVFRLEEGWLQDYKKRLRAQRSANKNSSADTTTTSDDTSDGDTKSPSKSNSHKATELMPGLLAGLGWQGNLSLPSGAWVGGVSFVFSGRGGPLRKLHGVQVEPSALGVSGGGKGHFHEALLGILPRLLWDG